MTLKQQWQEYLKKLQEHEKAVKKYIKTLPNGDVTTQDGGGSNPPTPPPPPPGT